MAGIQWPLDQGRPVIEITMELSIGSQAVTRRLLADTGAGSQHATFELILDEQDCLLCGGVPTHAVSLGGAYRGSFPVYVLRVLIPGLSFESHVAAVGAPTTPVGLDGIACFRFLNRFTYGNFGTPDAFGLEG